MSKSAKVLGMFLAVFTIAALGSATGFAAAAAQRLGISTASTSTGKAVSQVIAVTDSPNVTTTSTSYVAMPGMSALVTVPSTHPAGAQLTISFADESACYGGTRSNWCSVIVVVDGVEAAPGDGTDYAFDGSDGAGCCEWRGLSLIRIANVGVGTHSVVVEWAVVGGGGTVTLTAWSGERTLVILRAFH
jgi:hypothetical protein